MKFLKKAIITIILAANSAALCTEKTGEKNPTIHTEIRNDYNYWGYGAGIPTILSVKFGHRHQIDHHGFEYGVGATPLIYVTEAHIFGTYLYYPKPRNRAQMYLGLGVRGGGFLEINRAKFAYVGPGFIVGREYVTRHSERRFIQLALGAGALTTKGPLDFRSISFAFGYSY